jgi:membrane-bound serine protease (ClpP class)
MIGRLIVAIVTTLLYELALIAVVVGLSSMIGSKAKVVSKIDLEGMVKVKGELWKAQSTGERIDVGEEVTVVGQKRLKLIVRRDSDKSRETK